MARKELTDRSGRWFDDENCEQFREATEWNGSNHISKATGYHCEHEILYLTKGGSWILYRWQEFESVYTEEWYSKLEREEARLWLIMNDHDLHPSSLEPEFTEAELEIK